MKRMLFALMIGLLCASQPACSTPIGSVHAHEADRNSIQKQFDRWVHAYESGDARTITNIYAPDAILLLPNAKPIRGTTQLRALFDQLCRTKVDYTYRVKQLVVTGDWAFRWGFADIVEHRKTPAHGVEPVTVHLKFIDIWKKEPDGVWKIYRDSSVIDAHRHPG